VGTAVATTMTVMTAMTVVAKIAIQTASGWKEGGRIEQQCHTHTAETEGTTLEVVGTMAVEAEVPMQVELGVGVAGSRRAAEEVEMKKIRLEKSDEEDRIKEKERDALREFLNGQEGFYRARRVFESNLCDFRITYLHHPCCGTPPAHQLPSGIYSLPYPQPTLVALPATSCS